MELNKLSKTELEQMSYIELTEKLLEEGQPLNTLEIFKKICEILGLNEEIINDKIGDFYTSLTTDKTFILLDDGKWDLQKNHPATVNLGEEEIEDEEEIENNEENEEEIGEMESEDLDSIDTLDDMDELDDDLDDDELTIIPEDELDDDSM